MKHLFIHFSDIHFDVQDTLTLKKIEDIIKTINLQIERNDIQEVFVIVSGDLAYSGKNVEYAYFDLFIQTLKAGLIINKNKIHFVFSPGNHDIDFQEEPKTRKYILTNKREDFETIKNEYLNKMQSFFDYANKFGNFLENKEISIHNFCLDQARLKIININTAPFSTYKDDIDDNDRGLHSLSESALNLIKRNGCEIVLMVMHHSPDWFDENTLYKLKDCLKSEVDIVFCGHEHVNDEFDYNFGNGNVTTKICGGPLSPGSQSLFNCCIIDTCKMSYETIKFEWNETEEYEMINYDEKRNLTKFTCLKPSFVNRLLADNSIATAEDFRDFYVFPELLCEKEFNTDEKTFSNITDLKKELNTKRVCIINGNDYSGKTTLAKYLFISYVGERFPILFDLKSLDKSRISKIIPNAFDDQYDKKLITYNKFLKEDKDKKVAIVDDADKIGKNEFELLVEELKKNFGLVIIINGLKSEYDLLELTKKHLADSENCLLLKIGKFYNEQRKQLIKNVYSFLSGTKNNNDIDSVATQINKTILNRIKFFNLYPPFIILFVKSMVNNGLEVGTKDVFNEVFSSNITRMMIDAKADVGILTVLFQRIAYFIHVNKEYPISQESLLKVIYTYNKEGAGYRPEVDAVAVINEMVNSRIIAKTSGENKYCFTNNAFLAYFVAKEWLKIQDFSVLAKIINNVCYGINSDILLYICFMYENSQKLFFDKILQSANNHFNKCEEIDFLKNNVKFVLKDKKDLHLRIPSAKDKQNAQDSIKEQEKNITRESKINYIDIYDYDENEILDESQTFFKGFKYIEIISKILPDFLLKMEPDQIKEFVDSIYRLPNKLLYSAFKPIDDEFDEKLSKIKIDDVEKYELEEMQGIAKLLVLNIYDLVSRYATSKHTIVALEKYDTKNNLNYMIQKSMFYSECGDTDKFDRTIMAVYEKTDNKAIKNMVKRIYSKHLMYNEIQYHGQIQSHISQLFPYVNKPNKGMNNKTPFLSLIRGRKKK